MDRRNRTDRRTAPRGSKYSLDRADLVIGVLDNRATIVKDRFGLADADVDLERDQHGRTLILIHHGRKA